MLNSLIFCKCYRSASTNSFRRSRNNNKCGHVRWAWYYWLQCATGGRIVKDVCGMPGITAVSNYYQVCHLPLWLMFLCFTGGGMIIWINIQLFNKAGTYSTYDGWCHQISFCHKLAGYNLNLILIRIKTRYLILIPCWPFGTYYVLKPPISSYDTTLGSKVVCIFYGLHRCETASIPALDFFTFKLCNSSQWYLVPLFSS